MIKEFLLKVFNYSTPNYEYWAYIDNIIIPEDYKKTQIGKLKYKRKLQYYNATGKFQSRIILDSHWKLLDGYSSYVIAKQNGITKVPVYFK